MDLLEELRMDSYVIPLATRHAAADEIERLRGRLAQIANLHARDPAGATLAALVQPFRTA